VAVAPVARRGDTDGTTGAGRGNNPVAVNTGAGTPAGKRLGWIRYVGDPPGRWDVARSDDADARAARWEREVHDLSTQVAFLQEELARRKVTEGPRHVRQLEERLAAATAQVARLTENNERLVATLKEARAQIVSLKEEIDRLAQPPSGYGTFLSRNDDGTVDVFTRGAKMRVTVSPAVDVSKLRRGQEVLLNDALNVVEVRGFERVG